MVQKAVSSWTLFEDEKCQRCIVATTLNQDYKIDIRQSFERFSTEWLFEACGRESNRVEGVTHLCEKYMSISKTMISTLYC